MLRFYRVTSAMTLAPQMKGADDAGAVGSMLWNPPER
jgi:hypothetical protein